MEDGSSHPDDLAVDYPAGARENWAAIGQLLADGDYTRAAYHIQQLEKILREANEEPLARLLAVIGHLCLICHRFQDDFDFFRQAEQFALEQEALLQQELLAITHLIEPLASPRWLAAGGSAAPATAVPGEPAQAPIQKLWLRLQGLIKQLAPRPAAPELGFWLGHGRPLASSWSRDFTAGSDGPPPAAAGKSAFRSDPAAVQVPHLAVYCLAPFRTYVNDRLVEDWKGNKSKSIFKYLLTQREQRVPIEVLIDLFWENDEPESGRRNLYQAIYLLRQAFQICELDASLILSANGAYEINPAVDIWLDHEDFQRHYENGKRLEKEQHKLEAIAAYEQADALYESDFLMEDVYEDWTASARETLKTAHLDLLTRLGRFHFTQQNWAMSVAYGEKILRIDSCTEPTHRLLMEAYFHLGQRHLALRQFHRCAEALKDELGVEPAVETLTLYQELVETPFNFS